MVKVPRTAVLRRRMRVQGLTATDGVPVEDAPALDLGVQDTGPDGSAWALRIRGVDPAQARTAIAWTLRGAPHAYRRADLPQIVRAVSPFSEADAAKRVFDAAKPLREAGVPVLEALRVIAVEMRDIVRGPTVKGEMSTRLHERLGPEYQRYCRACRAVHLYEQPFRLSALYAGLELEPGTSPPVLRRVPRWPSRAPGPGRGATGPLSAPQHLQVIRAYLHLLGPATVKDVAGYVDAPVKDIQASWPTDVVEVDVDGVSTWLLESDTADLRAAATGGADGVVRLLGPFDPLLQAKDRHLLVPDEVRRKQLYRTLGRPGAVVVDGEPIGAWRPVTTGRRFGLRLDPWQPLPARVLAQVESEAQRLAAHRGLELAGVAQD